MKARHPTTTYRFDIIAIVVLLGIVLVLATRTPNAVTFSAINTATNKSSSK